MFQNYGTGVRTSVAGCNCGGVVNTPSSALTAIKDPYGNIVKLKWDRSERFSITLTTDSIIPVFDGSRILRVPGEVPNEYGATGMYAYNVVDYKCWRYEEGEWVDLGTIVSPTSGEFVELFSNPNSHTLVEFLNFRGEVIHSLTHDSNEVIFIYNDDVAKIFPQGTYTANIYQIAEESRLVRTMKITVGKTRPNSPGCGPAPGRSPNEYVTRDEYEDKIEEIEGKLGESQAADKEYVDKNFVKYGETSVDMRGKEILDTPVVHLIRRDSDGKWTGFARLDVLADYKDPDTGDNYGVVEFSGGVDNDLPVIIRRVRDGVEDSDAATVAQVKQAVADVDEKISNTGAMFSVSEDGGLYLGNVKITPAEEVLF